jgi:hypothetical protein
MRMPIVAGFVALLLSGCVLAGGPQLSVVGDPTTRVGISADNIAAGRPFSFGSIMLCVSAPTTATISAVSIDKPEGGIRVDAFATRPNPFTRGEDGLGSQAKTLVEFSPSFAPGARQSVTGVCPGSGATSEPGLDAGVSELGVQVSWDGVGPYAGGPALDVTYSIGGQAHTLVVLFGIWLCASTCPESLSDIGTTVP